MGNIITIDDGSEVFDIVNQRGEHLGQFTFIPSDIDIVNRYDETVKTFEELQGELERGEYTDFNEVSRKMCEKIDYLFAAPVSEKRQTHGFERLPGPSVPRDLRSFGKGGVAGP